MKTIDLNTLSRTRAGKLAFIMAALAAVVMLFISESSHWRSREAFEDLSELSDARVRMQRLLLSVTDAETAQRGYLLTGRQEYLVPYSNAVLSLPVTLTWLRQYYASREGLDPAMVELQGLVADRLSVMAAVVAAYDEGRREAAMDMLGTNIGSERMAAIREAGEALLAQESQRGERARQRVLATLTVNRIGVAAMTALSLLALFMYFRQARALEQSRASQVLAVQAERDHLEAEVQRRTEELTDLSQHLMSAREDERGRLARELHDELGALLTAAKLDVARIRTRIGTLSPEANERLVHLGEMLNAGIDLKRRIIENLRPSSLSNLGLVAALEILAREYEQLSPVKVELALQPVRLHPDSELTVYRLVQEALTNIAKYAKAGRVSVSLGLRNGDVEVAVTDDGAGFDLGTKRPTAHGLLGMRYRVEAQGGELLLRSKPGQGTRVAARLPASPAEPSAQA